MKISVIGAAGRLGSLLIKEGCARGHRMTAVVRDVYMVPNPEIKVLECDAHDIVFDDIWDQDVVIDAFGVWEETKVQGHVTSLAHLADVLSEKTTRLLVAGTAGNLRLDAESKTRIIDLPDFPKGAYPVVKAMCDAYDLLKTRADVIWTYLSPAPDFRFEGEKSGVYRVTGDVLPRNARGKSEIGYADFAAAILDETENPNHIHEHICVYSV